MKFLFTIFLIIITKLISFSQSNLVPNPSFEFGSECANIEVGNKIYDWLLPEKQSFSLSPSFWTTSTPVGTSDWFCPSNLSHSGNAHIRALVETQFGDPKCVEYATAKLLEPLVVNKTYFYRFFVRADAYDGDKVGLGFTIDRPVQKWKWKVIKDGLQVINNSVFKPEDGWVEIKGVFLADQAYEWITIGCFGEDFIAYKASQSYRYDDVRVWEYCPPQMLIENQTYEFKESAYEAGIIRAGYDVGASTPNGSVVVGSTADIIYKAETEVSLEPGFETQPGAEFLAFIAPCGRNCDYLPQLIIGNDLELCNPQSIEIGMPTLPDDITFQWSAEPQSALQYLSNINITNPVFTPPVNSCGHATYTLTIYNNCDESDSKSIHIKYSTSSLQNSLQILNLIQDNFSMSFDAIAGPCTDKVVVQVLSSQNNYSSAVYTKTFLLNTGSPCCEFQWSSTESIFSPCYNYKIKITAYDICTQNETNKEIVWTRSPYIQILYTPNVITANNDGINDCLAFSVSGAEFYHVKVYDKWGLCVYDSTGNISNNQFCTWIPQQNLSGNPYFWVADFWNSCGNEINTQGFVQLLYGNNKYGELQQNKIGSYEINNLFNIYPNPAKNEVSIAFNFDENAEVILLDITGREVIHSIRDNQVALVLPLHNIASGIYYISIKTEKGVTETQKLIKYE